MRGGKGTDVRADIDALWKAAWARRSAGRIEYPGEPGELTMAKGDFY
jgi:hypothetical protein